MFRNEPFLFCQIFFLYDANYLDFASCKPYGLIPDFSCVEFPLFEFYFTKIIWAKNK